MGGMWAVGNTKMATPWTNDWGRILLEYLLGNEENSQKAYQALQEAEEKEMIANHDRLESERIAGPKDASKISGFIYIIKAKNIYKIGRSQHFESRVNVYRTENPFKTTVIFQKKVDGYVEVEKDLLDMFKDKRVKGEWFKLSKEDILWIKENII